MKRVLLLSITFVFAITASFAQKKAVNQAQSIAKTTNADFAEARALINGALENEETKNDAKTWYVAGYIEDQQFNGEKVKEMLGQQANYPVMYQTLLSIYPFFEKAYELDQLPDAKGKVKPRYTKDVKNILSVNHVYYINSGAFYFDQKDYRKAYTSFDQYLKISEHSMFVGEPIAEKDSNYLRVQFYLAVASTQLGEPETAISALSRAKDSGFKGEELYQYLYHEYKQLNDSINMEKTLMDGLNSFPEETFFIFELIDSYIKAGKNEEATAYLTQALELDPTNSNLYNVLGNLYEAGLKNYEQAEINYKKAIELDPENIEAVGNIGRIYYNQAVSKLGEANMITDNKLYKEEEAKAKGFFEKALPYYERAYQAKPDHREYQVALRGIYYNLNMNEKFEAIEAKMAE